MIVKFDALNRFERPLFYLCNPGTKYEDGVLTKAIGILSDTSDEELNVEFNTTSTLSLRAYKRDYEDPDENEFFHDLFNKIQNRRLIYIEDLGFFVIRNTETGYDDGITYKDIEAYSCEDEIANKQVPYIADDTYAFEDLLDKLIDVIPMWQKGYVEDSLRDKHRTFEDVDTDQNILDFMIEDMQEAYECIFTFDTIHRSVQVYEQENYVHETDIHITKNDIVTNVTVQEDSNDMYTALSVYGDGDLTVSAVNPLGGSTIYNFDYYLDWMSPELSAKVKTWQDLVKYYSNYNAATPEADNYPQLGEKYAEQYTEYLKSVAQIETLKTRRDMYQRCYDNIAVVAGNVQVSGYNEVIVSTGGKPIPENMEDVEELQAAVKALIDEAKRDIANEEAHRDQLDAAAKATLAQMQAINEKVDITKYFTYEEYEELSCYISEGTYTDQYVIITDVMTYSEQYAQLRTLFQRALGQLEKISKPTEEFSLDTENFLFQQSFSHFAGQLETGCIINVGVATDEVVPLFLSAMVVNYDDLTLSLTFGNRFCRFDPKAMFKDVLGDVKRSSNSIEFLKDAISPLEHGGIEKFREHLAELRDLSKQHALEATNQSVVIDDTGYTGKKVLGDYDFDPRQIKIVNNGMFLTKDAWDTCDVAIGELTFLNEDGSEYYEYGINAHILAGDIIIGSELHLLYNDVTTGENKDVMERMNKFEFDANGLRTEFDTFKNGATDRMGKIEADASSFKAEFSTYKGDIANQMTQFQLDADGLHSQVTKLQDGDELVSIINQTADSVTIKANRIDLTGYVSINNGVQITESGYLIAKNAQFNDVSMNNLTMSGNISITGNIQWNANNSPCLALYGRSSYTTPVGSYSSYPASSATTWHRNVDVTNDFYVSYTYDGGSSWTYPVRYQGRDGRNGTDATVTRESMVNALLNNLQTHPEDGIYSEKGPDGRMYIGVQATVIKGTLVLGDELKIEGNADIGGNLKLGGKLYLNDDSGVDLLYPNGDELGDVLNLTSGTYYNFTDNSSSVQNGTTPDTSWTITPKQESGKMLDIKTDHHVHANAFDASQLYATKIGCTDLVCKDLNVGNIHTHTGLTVPNGYGIKTYPYGTHTQRDEVTLTYMDSNGYMYYGNTNYHAQFYGDEVYLGSTQYGLQGNWSDYIEVTGQDVKIYAKNNISLSTIAGSYNSTNMMGINGNLVYLGSNELVNTETEIASQTIYLGTDGTISVSMPNNVPLKSQTNGYTMINGYSQSVYVGDTDALNLFLRGKTVKLNDTSGDVVTSDRRNKYDIENISELYDTFIMNLQPVRFKYNNGSSGRYHVGFIAQDVMNAMIESGLDSTEFGGYNDISGTGELGLIYSEFISLNTYMIQKLYRRIEDLERKVELLSRN